MTTIHKFAFKVNDIVRIRTPADPFILKVECQGLLPCLWAVVDTNNPPVDQIFYLFGTGEPLGEGFAALEHVSTFQQEPFVWHMFRDRKCTEQEPTR